MKLGIVDVGGGMRGVYAAGVLDRCLELGIRFDLGIGVSAGAANLITFAAGQKGRTHRFYTIYAMRRQYMGVWNYLSKRSFIDMDYVYGTLSNSDGEDPLDYEAAMQSPMELLIVATEAETGKARYFDKSEIPKNRYDALKASCAIPAVCKPYPVDGIPYYDGALGDTIPIQKAFELGCDKVVLLLTRPENTLRTPDSDRRLAARIQKKYPLAAEKLCQRAEQYNRGVALAREYAAQGKLLIIAPEDTFGVSTLTRDKAKLGRLYSQGCADGVKVERFL